MDSVGTYWIPLKTNMIPFLDREVDQVIDRFFASEGDENAMRDLELLKISINARIHDYDNYFKKRFTDQRIAFLEKQKFKLKKLIFEQDNQDEEENQFPSQELHLTLQSELEELEQEALAEQERIEMQRQEEIRRIKQQQKLQQEQEQKNSKTIRFNPKKKTKQQFYQKKQFKFSLLKIKFDFQFNLTCLQSISNKPAMHIVGVPQCENKGFDQEVNYFSSQMTIPTNYLICSTKKQYQF